MIVRVPDLQGAAGLPMPVEVPALPGPSTGRVPGPLKREPAPAAGCAPGTREGCCVKPIRAACWRDPTTTDFTALPDLAAKRLGGMVLAANDEFFAPKENLLEPAAPVFAEGRYTDRGKWMDGWETRRSRSPGYDWCVVRLGLPGVIRGVVVDTAFFRGNYPEACSLEGCVLAGYPDVVEVTDRSVRWVPVLPRVPLQG